MSATFRADVERELQADPIAHGVLGTLLAAAVIAVSLALVGLLVALLGAMRDPRAERELAVHGLGPRALAHELRLRIVIAAALGLLAGFALAAVLTRLAVAAVGSSDDARAAAAAAGHRRAVGRAGTPGACRTRRFLARQLDRDLARGHA